MFRGHPIPSESEKPESLVKYSDLPTPRLLQDAFERMSPPTARGKEGLSSRDIYVNSQWALGGEGTGAPVRRDDGLCPANSFDDTYQTILYMPFYLNIKSGPLSQYRLECTRVRGKKMDPVSTTFYDHEQQADLGLLRD